MFKRVSSFYNLGLCREWKKYGYIKYLSMSSYLPWDIRFILVRSLFGAQSVNRCNISGRHRGVFRHWGLSRIKVKSFIDGQWIGGWRGSSW